ncbi:MAG: hypothetical protein K2N86_04585, partial [Rikenellaceae bacterium]|nr:hypothetical protein [Rikenellaceae bacterium]
MRCVRGEIVPDIDPNQTITVGNIEWMQVNLANPKQAAGGATFATKLPSQCSGVREESHGKFYQWGVNVAWSSTGASDGGTPNSSWQTSTSYPTNWNTQPCPDGYRMPTKDEFDNLINNSNRTNGGDWSETDYGYIILTLKTDTSKKLEFPAVGYRLHSDGSLGNAGTWGNYWSSIAGASSGAYVMYFSNSSLAVSDNNNKRGGFSARCVKDEAKPDFGEPVEMVDGIEWMQVNLANPKQADGGATFATKLPSQLSGVRAESHGKFYQWGINVAWNTTGSSASGATPSGSWNTSTYPADWNTQPCPDGYRLPTNAEFQNLIDNCTRTDGGGWSATDYGYITLTLKTDTSKKLEFPAVGGRSGVSSGTLLSSVGADGNYWSSVAYSSYNAYHLYFGSGSLNVGSSGRQYGLSVRCVKESVPDIDPTQTVTIGGTEWTQVNLANPK